jgi:hypothetical protein
MGLVLPPIEAYQVQHLPIVKAYADQPFPLIVF